MAKQSESITHLATCAGQYSDMHNVGSIFGIFVALIQLSDKMRNTIFFIIIYD